MSNAASSYALHPYDGFPSSPVTSADPSAGADTVDHLPAGQRSSNHLLRLLALESSGEYDRLMAVLQTHRLGRGDILFEPGGKIPHVYFPEDCVMSLVKVLAGGRRIEVGTTGLEGTNGLPMFLGAVQMPLECFVQIPGDARGLPAEQFAGMAPPGSAFHGILQRYALYLFDQSAQTAACNRLHALRERCARWLLMTHDRVLGDQLELTQQFLGIMLGVRRAGVSEAADLLQKEGLIRYRRGKVSIEDRAGLELASCECYAADRADFARLLGSLPGSLGDAARSGGG